MAKPVLAKTLTYLGLLPFVVSSLLSVLSFEHASLDFLQINLLYAAVIVSFIAGIHWGLYLLREQDIPLNLFIHSNIAALTAWFAALINIPFSLLVFIVCFVYLLLIDRKLSETKLLETWFLRMRHVATGVVIVCLLVSFVALSL